MKPTLQDIAEALMRIRPHIHRTPVLTSVSVDRIAGAEVFFKCENFQKAGSFKFRGATNAVFSLSDEALKRGVATHSSGNHAAALALAASLRGAKAHIVMPDNSPEVKKRAVAGYGAKITYCEPVLEARETTLARVLKETGAEFVHPYNDLRVISGQGTAALELLEQAGDLDVVITPVGGGGLLSGTAISVKGTSPVVKIYGAEPEGADDAARSFQSGKLVTSHVPDTIADGLLSTLGSLTFPIIRENVDGILLATEDSIIKAMRLVFERMKIVVEPSAAVGLAMLLENREKFAGKRVGVILSGGNVDLARLPFKV